MPPEPDNLGEQLEQQILDEAEVRDVIEEAESQDVEVEKTVEEAETPNYEVELQRYKAELDQLKEQLKPFQERERDGQLKALDAIVERVLQGAENAVTEEGGEAKPLANEEKEQLRGLVHAGAEYARQAPVIRQERIAAMAINFAHDIVGDNATVSELRKVAEDMMSLGDAKSMELWKTRLLREKRNSAQVARKAVGADTILNSGNAPPPLNTEQQLVNALVNRPDSLSPQQFAKARDAMARGVYPSIKQNRFLGGI